MPKAKHCSRAHFNGSPAHVRRVRMLRFGDAVAGLLANDRRVHDRHRQSRPAELLCCALGRFASPSPRLRCRGAFGPCGNWHGVRQQEATSILSMIGRRQRPRSRRRRQGAAMPTAQISSPRIPRSRAKPTAYLKACMQVSCCYTHSKTVVSSNQRWPLERRAAPEQPGCRHPWRASVPAEAAASLDRDAARQGTRDPGHCHCRVLRRGQ